MKILIFLHFLSHLFSLAQYEYFIEIMIIPCTHLFNHAAPWIHPFTPTPAFTKILRCNQSCQIAQCLKQAADYCCHCKLNYTITGFYEVFLFLADTNTKSWLSDSEKGNNAHFVTLLFQDKTVTSICGKHLYTEHISECLLVFLIAKLFKQQPSLLLPAHHTTLNNEGGVDEANPAARVSWAPMRFQALCVLTCFSLLLDRGQ